MHAPEVIINSQVLPRLMTLLSNNYKESIKKEACLILSNITAGNTQQIQAVIDANIIAPLVALHKNAEFDIKKEVAWAISNAASGGSHEQLKYLVNQGCIKTLCDLLICPDSEVVNFCLEGLESILKVGETDKNASNTDGVNLFAQMINDAKGLDKIKNLLCHDDTEINEKATKIIDTYWLGTMPGEEWLNFVGSEVLSVPSRFQP